MSDFTDQSPERRRPSWLRRTPARPSDLEVLRSHPSLTSLSDKGTRLDRLPLASTAWTFTGALAISVFAFGTESALVVVMMLVLAVLFTMSAMHLRDVPAARGVLTFARVCLAAWVIGCAAAPWLA